jgi:very-short-patch-repair endonuclease
LIRGAVLWFVTNCVSRPGIHVHRSRHADTTTHYGIRVTTPARTLVDLADVQTIAGHEVDAVYSEQKLVIELDSRQFHSTPRAFEQDRDRDADVLNAGFSTLRITDQRLKEQQAKEAHRLLDNLRSRI